VYYDEAREFARLMTLKGSDGENMIVTGGGPGVMEAGNRGALDAGWPINRSEYCIAV
jgi:predicted Rossmann-fold nucleotide-binding protein